MVTKKCGMQVVVYRIVGRPSTVILAKNSHTFREELCKKGAPQNAVRRINYS